MRRASLAPGTAVAASPLSTRPREIRCCDPPPAATLATCTGTASERHYKHQGTCAAGPCYLPLSGLFFFFFSSAPEIDPIRAFFFARGLGLFLHPSFALLLLLLAIDAVVLAALTIAKCCFSDRLADDFSTPLPLRHYSPIAEPYLRYGLCPICCRYSPDRSALRYPDISSTNGGIVIFFRIFICFCEPFAFLHLFSLCLFFFQDKVSGKRCPRTATRTVGTLL